MCSITVDVLIVRHIKCIKQNKNKRRKKMKPCTYLTIKRHAKHFSSLKQENKNVIYIEGKKKLLLNYLQAKEFFFLLDKLVVFGDKFVL